MEYSSSRGPLRNIAGQTLPSQAAKSPNDHQKTEKQEVGSSSSGHHSSAASQREGKWKERSAKASYTKQSSAAQRAVEKQQDPSSSAPHVRHIRIGDLEKDATVVRNGWKCHGRPNIGSKNVGMQGFGEGSLYGKLKNLQLLTVNYPPSTTKIDVMERQFDPGEVHIRSKNAGMQEFGEGSSYGKSKNMQVPTVNYPPSITKIDIIERQFDPGQAPYIAPAPGLYENQVEDDVTTQSHEPKSSSFVIVGLCKDMCPAEERERREKLRDLAVFEQLDGNPGKTSRDLAVKKFCRTFTGVHTDPSLIRPLPVLLITLQYLLELLKDNGFSFDLVHGFLFDRTRAIRQELDMQRLANDEVIDIYEKIVRFHIVSQHELSSRAQDSKVLNLQQLSKALISLLHLYDLVHSSNSNKSEFQAYYVLLNLGNHGCFKVEPISIWFRHVKPTMLRTLEMKFAREVLRCHYTNNFKHFFRLVCKATFLQSCLMELHFNEVRLKALMAINQGAYKLHPIPLRDLAELLLIKEEDLEELCNLCGLSTGMDSAGIHCLIAKQSQFALPRKDVPVYECPFLAGTRDSYYQQVTRMDRK